MKPGSPITMLWAPGSGQVSTKRKPVAPSRSPTIPKVLLRDEEGPKGADRVRQMIRDLHYEVVEGEGPDPGYGERRAASASPFGSLGGTQISPRAILRPDGDVGLVGVERDLGLEAFAGGGSQWLQLVGAGTGEDLPGGDLRRPVPTNVERYAAFGPFLGTNLCDDGRPVLGAADPPGAECPVGLDGLWEAGLEEERSVAGMLGEEGSAAPTDEHVPVREVLHVGLVGRERVLWEGILGGQLGRHDLLVEPEADPARGLVHVLAPVVEEGDGAVFLAAGVVLEGETGPLAHREVAPLPAEAPDHLPALPVHLVDGRGLAGADEQVAVVVLSYGVDVEVVVAVALVGVRPGGGLLEADVLQAVPLEEDLSSLDVHLLDDPVHHGGLLRAAGRGKIHRHPAVDGEERGVPLGYEELVVVPREPVPGADPRHLPVVAVEDQVLPVAPAAVHALPPGQHRLPSVALHPEVHRVLDLFGHRAEPHRSPLAVEDHRPVLRRIPLPESVLRGGEQVALGHTTRPPDDLDRGRGEVRARAEGPPPAHAPGGGARPDARVRLTRRQGAEREQCPTARRDPQKTLPRPPRAQTFGLSSARPTRRYAVRRVARARVIIGSYLTAIASGAHGRAHC